MARSKQTVRKSGPKRGVPVVKRGGESKHTQKQKRRKNNAGKKVTVDGHYAPKRSAGGGGGGGGQQMDREEDNSGSLFSFDSMDASSEEGGRGGVDQLPPSQMRAEKEERNYNMGLPYFTLDRQPHSNVQERNDSSSLSTTTTIDTTNPSCMNVSETLAAPSNASVSLREQREPSSSMGDNHPSHSSSAPTSLAPLVGRGRGIHRTQPALMTSQDSLLHVPDRVLSTLDVNTRFDNSNKALKSCMKNKPKSTNTTSNVAVKTEETEMQSCQLDTATATDMSCPSESMTSADIIFSANLKSTLLSLLPVNNGDNEGASMSFINKMMKPRGLILLNRRIFEENLLDSIEVVDNEHQRRYFVRTAGSTAMPYKPWNELKKSDAAIGGKNKKKNDQNAPERPRSAYTFFTMAKQKETEENNPDVNNSICQSQSKKNKVIAKLMNAKWKALMTSEKELYVQLAKIDWERYQNEMKDYTASNPLPKLPDKIKAKLLSILPTNDGKNKGAPIELLIKNVEGHLDRCNGDPRQIFEQNMLGSFELDMDSKNSQSQRYFNTKIEDGALASSMVLGSRAATTRGYTIKQRTLIRKLQSCEGKDEGAEEEIEYTKLAGEKASHEIM